MAKHTASINLNWAFSCGDPSLGVLLKLIKLFQFPAWCLRDISFFFSVSKHTYPKGYYLHEFHINCIQVSSTQYYVVFYVLLSRCSGKAICQGSCSIYSSQEKLQLYRCDAMPYHFLSLSLQLYVPLNFEHEIWGPELNGT